MSFANFGIGLGAFAQGLNQGMDTGLKLRQVRDENEIRRAREKGMKEAEAAQASAIENLVQVGSAADPSNTMTVPTYEVEGQKFSDQGSARKAAQGRVGTVTDFFYQNEAPKIADLYMKQGDVEKAETWTRWIKDKNVKKGFEYGVRAYQAATTGDDEGAVKNMMKMYNHPGYFDDGRTATGYKPIKGEDGSVAGYAITIKDAQGNESILNVEKGQGMLSAIAPFVDPKTVYEQGYNTVMAEQQARLDIAKEDRKYRQQSALQGQRDDASMDRTVTGRQMDAASKSSAVNQKVEILKQNGYSDEWIAENLPGILGIGDYKKAISPDDARLRLHEGRIKNDYSYSRKTQAEQQAIIAKDMQMIYGDQPKQRANPMAGGISGQGAKPAGRGPMILDTTTGKMVPYTR